MSDFLNVKMWSVKFWLFKNFLLFHGELLHVVLESSLYFCILEKEARSCSYVLWTLKLRVACFLLASWPSSFFSHSGQIGCPVLFGKTVVSSLGSVELKILIMSVGNTPQCSSFPCGIHLGVWLFLPLFYPFNWTAEIENRKWPPSLPHFSPGQVFCS